MILSLIFDIIKYGFIAILGWFVYIVCKTIFDPERFTTSARGEDLALLHRLDQRIKDLFQKLQAWTSGSITLRVCRESELRREVELKLPQAMRRWEQIRLNVNANETFVINKGKSMDIQLKNHQSYFTIDQLMYVVSHELSHMLCKEKDHTELFWEINYCVLKLAQVSGLYVPEDYSKHPFFYNKINVDQNILLYEPPSCHRSR